MLIGRLGEVKLSDFGVAAVLSLTAREPGGPTLRNFYSRPYAAPEQILQRAPGFASDVYSFSLVVAALFVGQEPGEDFEPAGFEAFFAPAGAELVRAGVAQGVEGALDVEDADRATLEIDDRALAGR